MKPIPFLLAFILFTSYFSLAQDKTPVKFGKISPSDFIIKQAFDTGASAVIIADVGSTVFEGNNKGYFSLIFKHQKRIKILNKNGFDAATVKINLYSDSDQEEDLINLKAITYNLEDGKVVETKLESSAVFKDKLDKNYTAKKFTLPAVKEGSIIEYSYTISSDFLFNLQPWFFQDEYPTLWSEYEVGIPEFFSYVTLNQGYYQAEHKQNSFNSSFNVSIPGGADRDERIKLDGQVKTDKWIMKNIPALKPEGYITSIRNYLSSIEFQLAGIKFPYGVYRDMLGNWKLLGEKLMKNEHFGESLSKNNNWLDDEIKKVTIGATSKVEKAQKIFAYVTDNFTCISHTGVYLETSLKDAFKKHSGRVSDINLLLIAMLRHEGINADPIILSTRNHGLTSEIYPLLQRFNYVVCSAEIDGNYYNLDASQPFNGFDRIPPYCYNGHARLLKNDNALPVYFDADSLKEQKLSNVIIINDAKVGLIGSFKSNLGYYESYDLREKLSKSGESEYINNIKTAYGFEVDIKNAGIDSLKKTSFPVSIHYDFNFKPGADESMLYFNPMLTEGRKENPFKSAERQYPVSMPYTSDDIYIFSMEIPNGYVVEEIPKSAKVAFNETEGFFEYLIQKTETNIQLRSRVKMNKANFLPEDYATLRDFFGFIVKKQSEQIVFKKKN